MPLLDGTGYRPGWLFRNAHASTILPSMWRRVLAVSYDRQRLELPDGDFLDPDWSRVGGRRAAVPCHGLEGNSERPYMRGMARAFNRAGWDVAAMNFRGCSGEPNRLARSYHSGVTGDLRAVLAAVLAAGCTEIVLVGFSLGGNLILKYLGEEPAGVADGARLADARTIIDFDDIYTAPLNGFVDAADYYARNSAVNWLDRIGVPTLLLSAALDAADNRPDYIDNP